MGLLRRVGFFSTLVGNGLFERLDARGQQGELGTERLQQAGEHAHELSLGVRLGTTSETCRRGAQPFEEIFGAASAAVLMLREERCQAFRAERRGRLRRRVALDEGEQGFGKPL